MIYFFAMFVAGHIAGELLSLSVAWSRTRSARQPVVRQPLPTCTALPSAWRADRERVVEALDRAWDSQR